jgi:hypothetical protein
LNCCWTWWHIQLICNCKAAAKTRAPQGVKQARWAP